MNKLTSGISATLCVAALAASVYSLAEYDTPSESAVVNEAARLHAIIVGNPEWPYSAFQRGVYSIGADLSLTLDVEANTTMTFTATQPGVVIDDKYYINKSALMQFPFAQVQGTAIEVYDLATGALEGSHPLPSQFANVALSFAYDRVNDVVYAVTYGANNTTTTLTTFDPWTFEFSNDRVQLNTRFSAMACDGEGNLYGIKQNSSQLVKINPSDGSVSEPIASWNETPGATYPQSMTYDPTSRCLLWVFSNAAQETRLISINPDPDNTRVKALGNGLGKNMVHALYSTAPIADGNAPAELTDLTFRFGTPGSTSGKVSFTAPSYTMNGEPLSGTLDVTLFLDGKEVETFQTEAGKPTEHTLECESDGNHRIGVVLAHESLKGPRSVVNIFAGFDTPTAVGNLKYKLTDGNITLSWDAPSGVNGGALDALTYVVMHNNDESVETSDTEYTYVVEGDVEVHNFTVTAKAGEKAGEAASIAGIVAGNPIQLPYSCDFSTAAQWELFTVINANDDNTLWKWFEYYKYAQCNKSYGDGAANDWLVTPPLAFEEGNVYALSFDMETSSPKPESYAIHLAEGTTLADVAAGRELYCDTTLINTGMIRKEVLFTAEKSCAMNLAFHYYSPDGIRINLDNILVECFGKATAPKAATDLKVIPGAEGALTAEFTFTAPSEQFDGEALKSIEKIEIRRDDTLIETILSPRPGSFISVEDKDVPAQGNYKYSVTPYNENGAGQTVSIEGYIGALTLPLECAGETGFEGFSFNNVGETGWEIDESTGELIYVNTATGVHNDIANTPFFNLKKGEVVSMTFTYSALQEEGTPQQLGMWIGMSSIKNNAIQNISPLFWVRAGEKDAISTPYSMVIPEDGTYAFHFSTYYPSNNNTGVRISNVKIETATDPGAPNKVNDISVKAADKGALSGTISFRMPLLSLDNNPLSGTVDATIYGPDMTRVGEVKGAEPGENVTAAITMIQGLHPYYITTSNELGVGGTTSWIAFAGVDTPLRVVEPCGFPTSDNLSVDISWAEPEKAKYDGWFDREQLRYEVYVDGEYVETVTRPEYFFTSPDAKQKVYTFGVVPVTDAGKGEMSDPVINILGTPLAGDFNETFADGSFDNEPWNISWTYFEECKWEVKENFKGAPALLLQSYVMTDSYAQFPKISLGGMREPTLEFEHYKYHGKAPNYEAGQFVEIHASDDEVNYTTLMRSSGESGSDKTEGWYVITLPLTRYANSSWVSLKLMGMVHENFDYAAVRSIKIYDAATLGLNDLNAASTAIYAADGHIMIEGAEVPVEIYTAGGVHVASTSENSIAVEPGVYIVVAGDKKVKVLVY